MTKMTEKQFDAVHSEGGEGYNPIRAAREAKDATMITALPVTADDLRRRLDALDCSAAREAGTFDAAKVAAIRAQIEAIEAAQRATFAAAWPLETTKTRRAEWNGFIRANSTSKGIRADVVAARIKAQGWTTDDLRAAVKLHNL